jgi:Flp pilus assembly protein TadG
MHMNTKQRKPRGPVHRRKGQSLVEFALGSILLVMLLATAIDLGRAFYTWQVVHQMAAEAAAYVARYPNNDCTIPALNNCTSDNTPPSAHPDVDIY